VKGREQESYVHLNLLGSTDTPQKVHWVGRAPVPVHSFQDVTLREQNLRFGARGIRAVKEVRNGGCDNLFDLGGNEETSHAKE
jgi:hypothetical protein